jgi:hypothetical protein
MIKLSILTIGIFFSIVLSYFLMPTIVLNTLPDCKVSTVFIKEEKNRTVVSKGVWTYKYLGSRGVGRYNGQLTYVPVEDGKSSTQNVSLSFETDNNIFGPIIKTKTTDFSLSHDNRAELQDIIKYVYKGLEPAHVNFNRIQLINNALYTSGINTFQPRTTCWK